MAGVLVLSADLLFGSQVQGALVAAGNAVELVGGVDQAAERLRRADREAPDVVLVDMTDAALDGGGALERLRADGLLGRSRAMCFYSHVDSEAKARAEAAGFDLIVPRSRMAREGAELIARLVSEPLGG